MTNKHTRPTSPHLQVYKLPLTAIISITHRLTGVFLSGGLIIIVYLMLVVSRGADDYTSMQGIANFWLLKLIYWGFIYALYFHLCHGVRHLLWDFGEGFAADKLNSYAIIELITAFALTIATCLYLR